MAAKYLESAAQQGYAPAQFQLAIAYSKGTGVEKNSDTALEWYTQAAGRGHSMAQRTLGNMYMNGEGVPVNKPLALAWYSILAEQGNALDVHRRDSLQQELSTNEIDEANRLKQQLLSSLSTANTGY